MFITAVHVTVQYIGQNDGDVFLLTKKCLPFIFFRNASRQSVYPGRAGVECAVRMLVLSYVHNYADQNLAMINVHIKVVCSLLLLLRRVSVQGSAVRCLNDVDVF